MVFVGLLRIICISVSELNYPTSPLWIISTPTTPGAYYLIINKQKILKMAKELETPTELETPKELETPTAYQLAVLEQVKIDNVDFLTLSDMKDNDFYPQNSKDKEGKIIGGVKANINGHLYISMKNAQGQTLQAIYLNKKMTSRAKVGDMITEDYCQYAYIIPKEGDKHAEGPNKGKQKEPFFVACPIGNESVNA